MADPEFLKDKPEDERRSAAYGVANKQLNAALDPIIFSADEEDVVYSMVRSADGAPSMLVFKNAALARAETNLNRDNIDAQGIKELAATIAGWPISLEHQRRQLCGMFTAGRVGKGDVLLVDGAIWAERYPETAQGVLDGSESLSIEARADKADCSICNTRFESADTYCEHLSNRRSNGAVRHLSGLKARGGAITRKPAGTNMRFDPNHIYVVAAHQDEAAVPIEASWFGPYLKSGETVGDLPASDFADPEGRRFPYKIHGKVIEAGWVAAWSAAHGGHTGTKDESAIAKLKRDKPSGVNIKESTMNEDEVSKIKADLDAALKNITDLDAVVALRDKAVSDLTAKLAEGDAARLVMLATARRTKVGATLTDEEWTAQKDAILAMPDPVFNLMASKMTALPPPPKPPDRKPALTLAGGSNESADRLTLH